MTDESLTGLFYRRTTDCPYDARIRKLIGDAHKVEAVAGYMPDLLWRSGVWWLVLPLFPTYHGVRFRVVGNRLHLMPNTKVPARG